MNKIYTSQLFLFLCVTTISQINFSMHQLSTQILSQASMRTTKVIPTLLYSFKHCAQKPQKEDELKNILENLQKKLLERKIELLEEQTKTEKNKNNCSYILNNPNYQTYKEFLKIGTLYIMAVSTISILNEYWKYLKNLNHNKKFE